MSATGHPLPQRILLIDDAELICGSLRLYLLARGFEVDAAPERGPADVLMSAHDYAAVVVDPYLTGGAEARGPRDLLEHVRVRQQGASLIVLTAYDSPSLRAVAARCQVDALLTKPQSVVSLERTIRRLTESQSLKEVSS